MPNFFFFFNDFLKPLQIIGVVAVVVAVAAAVVLSVVEVEYLTIGREHLVGLGFLRIHFRLATCQPRGCNLCVAC